MKTRTLAMIDNLTPIERRRLELDMTRAELSRQSGVNKGTLEAWANRKRIPRDVYVLRKVAQALQCHIEDLLEPDPDEVEAGE